MRAWREELTPLNTDDVLAALDECKGETEWWPSFADFRRALSAVRERRALEAIAALPEPNYPRRPDRLAEVLAHFGDHSVEHVTRRPAPSLRRRYKIDPETGHAVPIEPETECA